MKKAKINPVALNLEKNKTTSSLEAENILPGLKPVSEILRDHPEQVDSVFIRKGRKNRQSDEIIDLCRANKIRYSLLEAQAFSTIDPGNSQGVLARLFNSGFSDLDALLASVPQAPLPLLLALDQVQDPGNAGTMIRTLYALGGAGLILPRHQAAYLGAGAAKAAAGALHKLPIAKVTNLAQALDKAAEAGFTIYGADAAVEAESIYSFKPVFPSLLVLGSEESGLRPGIAKRCSCLKIPMLRSFDSLNVAQAAAIMLGFFAASRQ